MHWFLPLALAIPVLFAADHQESAPSVGQRAPRTDYICDGGGRVPVWYEGRQAILFLDGRLERLPGVTSGSGTKYSDGRREWTTKGAEAVLSAAGQSEQTRQRCRVGPLASWRPAPDPRRYQCTDGLIVEVAPRFEGAAVTFRGDTYQMREVPVATGNLYTDGARAWRGAAEARTFAEADGDAVFARGCHPTSPIETATLTGTATYRTRQALPAGAVVDVRLVDISRADAPADVLARQVLVTAGEQVPLPFSVTYAPGAVQDRRRYAVQATIAIDGRVRFRTTSVHPVFANGTSADPVALVLEPVR